MPGNIYIGTSGWNYPHWRDDFYDGVSQRNWLQHNATFFNSVEINASFYRLQKPETLKKWLKQTPAQFRFALKANRYLTHNRKLREPRASIRIERDNARPLGSKLAVVLWQLPGTFHCHLERLQEFAAALRLWKTVPHAMEFRHSSWFNDEVLDILAQHGIAVVQSDAADWPLWNAVSGELVYIRLHGHSRTYASAYSNHSLRQWAGRIRRWARQGRQVHVYFDNDAEGAAPRDALKLRQLLE
jgi:uncharacterized protein YecE (DUF72 family)